MNQRTKIELLLKKWQEDTKYSSSMNYHENESLQEIVSMGESAIPVLLGSIPRNPHVGLVLKMITHSHPHIALEDAGKMMVIASAWISWGKEKGYL